jgi:hypothetical protein
MAINPLDPLSLLKIFDYIDSRNQKMAKKKRDKMHSEVLSKKKRPFKVIDHHPGYSFVTKDKSMNIVGYTIPKLATAMEMPYPTLKRYVDNNIVPKPSLDVKHKNKKGIYKTVSIYVRDEAKIISNFIYDFYFHTKLTIDDYNLYKEKHDGRSI